MNKKIGNLFKGDKGIWMVFFFLCLISLIEVFSASSTLSFKSHNYMGPIIYHAGTILFGIVITIVTLNIPCRYFKLTTPIFLFLSYATLLWVLFFGESINGANRVIQLPGFTFQPSELAKGTMVLATAQILSAMQLEDDSGADPKAMKYILWLALPMIMLIGLENLSTAMLLFAVIFAMMFIGRVPLKQLGKVVGVVVLMGALAFGIGTLAGDDAAKTDATEQTTANVQHKEEGFVDKIFHRFGTWRNRLVNHQPRPENPKDYKVRENFQVAHSNFAIASSVIAWWLYPAMERLIARVRPATMNIVCVVVAIAGGILFSLYAISPPAGFDANAINEQASDTKRQQLENIVTMEEITRESNRALGDRAGEATDAPQSLRDDIKERTQRIDQELEQIDSELQTQILTVSGGTAKGN